MRFEGGVAFDQLHSSWNTGVTLQLLLQLSTAQASAARQSLNLSVGVARRKGAPLALNLQGLVERTAIPKGSNYTGQSLDALLFGLR